MSIKCEQYGNYPDQIEIYNINNLIINGFYYSTDFNTHNYSYYSIALNPDEARFVRRKINEWLDDHEEGERQ